MLEIIKDDLKSLGVEHDEFLSEQYLHDENLIESAIIDLQNKGLVYEGKIPPPKGKTDADGSLNILLSSG
jgi:arginyl-tRNA synthetase